MIRHAISFIKLYIWDGKWEGSWQRLGQQSDLGTRETQVKNKGKKLCMEVFAPHCHAVQGPQSKLAAFCITLYMGRVNIPRFPPEAEEIFHVYCFLPCVENAKYSDLSSTLEHVPAYL